MGERLKELVPTIRRTVLSLESEFRAGKKDEIGQINNSAVY